MGAAFSEHVLLRFQRRVVIKQQALTVDRVDAVLCLLVGQPFSLQCGHDVLADSSACFASACDAVTHVLHGDALDARRTVQGRQSCCAGALNVVIERQD